MSENKNKPTPGQAARAEYEEFGDDYPGDWNQVWDDVAQAAIDASDRDDLRRELAAHIREAKDDGKDIASLKAENKRLIERVRELEETVKYYVSEYGEWP